MSRPLNLSEAIEVIRNLSDALHKQETDNIARPCWFCAELDKAWKEATAFVVDYDDYLVAYEEHEKKLKATMDVMFEERLSQFEKGKPPAK